MFFENELPLDHELSLEHIANAWATENVEEAKAEEARGYESKYSMCWDYEYEMSWSAIEDDLELEGLEIIKGD